MGYLTVSEPSRDGSATPFVRGALTVMDPVKRLGGLEWFFGGRAVVLLLWLAWRGFGKLRVTAGVRTLDAQRRLYGKGRLRAECKRVGVPEEYAVPGSKQVTWCIPEASKHVQGRALDVDTREYGPAVMGALQEGCRLFGLRWGGEWHVRDSGHIEFQ